MGKVLAWYDMQIRPNYLLFYPYFVDDGKSSHTRYERPDQAKKLENHKAHILTSQAGRRLKYSINLLLEQAKVKDCFDHDKKSMFQFKVNFITLDLPAKQVFRACELLHPSSTHSDKSLNRDCLMRFIEECRRRYNLHAYIWKAETQRNGNIHYHLTTDTYMPFGSIRAIWNKILARKGYIDAYRAKQEMIHSTGFFFDESRADTGFCKAKGYRSVRSYEDQFRAWKYGVSSNWSDPNSTDIHSVKKIKDLARYMVKYMAKNVPGRRPVFAKQWGCSDNIAPSKKCIVEAATHEYSEFASLKDTWSEPQIINDFFTIQPFKKWEFKEYMPQVLQQLYSDFILSIQNDSG